MSQIRQMQDQALRLKFLINALKTNQLQLSKKIGVPYSQTNSIFHGKAGFSSGYVKKLSAKFKNVNTHWLLTGDGEVFLTESSQREILVLKEPDLDYQKSINPVPIITHGDDAELRKTLSENLKTLADRWEMKKNELFGLLMPGVQKQTVTNYMKGTSAPPLWVLIHLERITGIGLTVWLTRAMRPEELPAGPVSADVQGGEDQLSMVREQLRTLLAKLGG